MANTVQLKRGSGSDPSASDLVLGELAIRTDSGKIFLKKDNGSVAEVSGGGGIDDGDKGDITVSNSGDTWTIDNDAVTYAKIQNVSATDRLLGRDSSGAGVIEEISPSSVRTMLGLATSATTDTTNADNIGSGTLAAARVATLNQDTTGSAATLTTARTIAGTSFDGSANIDISYANLTNKLSVGDGGLTANNFTNTLKSKLDGIASSATNNGSGIGVTDGDKGDITVASSGTFWTIDADAVTYSKIQNVSATNRILGRDSSGAGVIEEITPANVRTMLGLATSATTDTTNADNISSGTLAAGRVATLNQDTTGSAATLTTARTIAGVSFDGSANISLNNNAITNGAGYITATLTEEQVEDYVGGMVTGNTETGITVTYQDSDGTLDFVVASQTDNNFTTTLKNKLDGIAASATNVTNNNQLTNGASYITSSGTSAACSGNAATATTLATARTIGGTSFDGSANIAVALAATATTLATARTIAGVSFDGSANISLNNNAITNGAGYITATLTEEQVEDYVGGMVTGNTETGITVTYQDSDGTLDFVVASQTDNNFTTTLKNKLDGIAASATNVTNNNQLTNGASYITSSGTSAACSGNAATATALATARNIAGVSFDGSANISLNNNAITNGAGYITSSGTSAGFSAGNASNLNSGTVATARLGSGTANSSSYLRGDGSWATISAGAEDGIFWENDQAVSSDYTITNGKNAMSAGPITINSGVTVTVGSGEAWTIV